MDVFQGGQVCFPVGVVGVDGVDGGVGADVVPDVDLHLLDEASRTMRWNTVSLDLVSTTEGDLQLKLC